MVTEAYTDTNVSIYLGDCLDWLKSLPDGCVDLVMCSPPYENARTYGIGFDLRGEDWVRWALPIFVECYRVSKGLTAWVVEGKTKDYRYSATPLLMMADLHRAGVGLRKPPAYQRVGIPGSGGPDWLRNDYEFVICATHGKLPWSENTAMGHPPKWAPGGEMSNRVSTGARVNHFNLINDPWGKRGNHLCGRKQNGSKLLGTTGQEDLETRSMKVRLGTGQNLKGGCASVPVLANPGNVIECLVGGGVMGSKLAHENEAPYSEDLATFFVKSFCPPGGIVLDPFMGSGTTLAAALLAGRRAWGIDVRQSQAELSLRRVAEAYERLAKNLAPTTSA